MWDGKVFIEKNGFREIIVIGKTINDNYQNLYDLIEDTIKNENIIVILVRNDDKKNVIFLKDRIDQVNFQKAFTGENMCCDLVL